MSIDGVSTGYREKIVLRDIDLIIRERDFLGVIGPNGGGKTTLLRLMLGLIRPWKGQIHYAPALREGDHIKIGYLPQDSGLDFRFPLTVYDVVRTGMMKRRLMGIWQQDRKQVEKSLQKVGLFNIRNKPFGELSGGQRQKALLARAIADNPALLILDEPDTFTDQRFENELYVLLKSLNEEMAIIMVSHDLGIISSHVKTIACVNGKLHYHHSNSISQEMLDAYECPIDIITHGHLPHRVLGEH